MVKVSLALYTKSCLVDILESKAKSEVCLIPIVISPIKDSNHNPKSENLAMLPMDFKLFIRIFKPKYKMKKAGIPKKKNTIKDPNQIGIPVVFKASG